ncbi:MAG: hypothetical protein DRO11_02820 [Methanobacteriota archaeon]|nr:MAG: hypothetical protein DRO11_02820 [Euryarchaeota archaeon]
MGCPHPGVVVRVEPGSVHKKHAQLPRLVVEKSPDYKTIFVGGVYGGHRPDHFEVLVHSTELEPETTLQGPHQKPTYKHVFHVRLVMTPLQAKSIAEWLMRHVREYEETFGKIRSPEEMRREEKVVARDLLPSSSMYG